MALTEKKVVHLDEFLVSITYDGVPCSSDNKLSQAIDFYLKESGVDPGETTES